MHVCHNGAECFVPPYIVNRLANSSNPGIRERAINSLQAAAAARATRTVFRELPGLSALPSPQGKKNRLVYNMNQEQTPLPGTLVRSENDGPTNDPAIDEAFDFAGATYDFYNEVLGRNSLDDQGMTLISSVHYGYEENNAYWNGRQMLYGDGDEQLFTRFTKSIEVVAHELTHGVVQYTSNLLYEGQAGALNEHFADALGVTVEQWYKKQAVHDPAVDWYLGGEIIAESAGVKGIRTFTAEKAYENNPFFGTDPQPKHMKDLYTGSSDYGGVHINSGIPNHAFYRIALEIGGNIWEKTGKIWYETLKSLTFNSQFQDAAVTSHTIAGKLFGSGSAEQKAVENGWAAVGIEVRALA